MKAVFVTNPSKVAVRDVDLSSPGAGEILVKMSACGICGSDIEKVYGKYGQPSMKLGHEPAGTVISVGSGVGDLKPGDRVFTHHHVPCYSCHYCLRGSETMCPTYYNTNLSPCGLSEEYVVPAWNLAHGGVLKIPDSMSFNEAAMIEPLACCARLWNHVNTEQGDSLAVFGAGSTGIMHMMMAKSLGYESVFSLDMNRFRLDFAGRLGAVPISASDPLRKDTILSQTSGRGVDLAIVATGNLGAFQDAIDVVRKGGTVIMFGVPSKGSTIQLDMSIVYSKEITVRTSYAATDRDTKKALDLINSKTVDVRQLITHEYTLSDSQKAFDHARAGTDAMKIVITD